MITCIRRSILRPVWGLWMCALSSFMAVSVAAAQEPPPGAFVEKVSFFNGGQYRYYVYEPVTKVETPWLVILLHGSGSNGKVARAGSAFEFEKLAEEHGGIVVYPEGYEKHWNDCRPDTDFATARDGKHDVGFLVNLKSDMMRTYNVDPDRVLLAGTSNGAHMVYRAALERPASFAAYAAFAANLTIDETVKCIPSGIPVDMMIIAGTDDPVSPYQGGTVSVFGKLQGDVRSAQATANYWVDLAGYDTPPGEIEHLDVNEEDESTVTSYIWSAEGKPRVHFMTVNGGGHVLPHPDMTFPPFFGNANKDVNGPRMMWEFFAGTFED